MQIIIIRIVFLAMMARAQQIPVQGNTMEQRYQSAADAIAERIPENVPLVILVPLNGTPQSFNTLSVQNARIALEVLTRVPVKQKYLLLSEGNTADYCKSGAKLTAQFLALKEGINKEENITVLLEEDSTTTVDNILLSEKLIVDNTNPSPERPVAVIIAGIADTETLWFGDIGHGARALTLAAWEWNDLRNKGVIQPYGFLPTNRIDTQIRGYSSSYNLQTWILGATGILYLPFFERQEVKPNQCNS